MTRDELCKLNTLLYLFGEEYTGRKKDGTDTAFPHQEMPVREARNLVNTMIARIDRSEKGR